MHFEALRNLWMQTELWLCCVEWSRSSGRSQKWSRIKICCPIRIRIRQEGFCISAAICAFLVRRTIKIFSRVKLKKRIYLGKRIYSRPVLV